LLELHPFIWLDRCELYAESLPVHPPNLRLIDTERPAKTWSVNPTFKSGTCHHCLFCFDPTSPIGEIQSLPLAFSLPTAKSATELCGKPRLLSLLHASLIFERLGSDRHDTPSLKECEAAVAF
jgi:hypothetical protein